MAAPTKLDDDVHARIAAALRAGGTLELAPLATGVGERTLQRWLERGRRGGARNARQVAVLEAVERARAEAEVSLVATMQRQARTSWRAAAWILERRWPERWGRERALGPENGDEPDPLDELDDLAARRRGRPTH
jgi:transposase